MPHSLKQKNNLGHPIDWEYTFLKSSFHGTLGKMCKLEIPDEGFYQQAISLTYEVLEALLKLVNPCINQSEAREGHPQLLLLSAMVLQA